MMKDKIFTLDERDDVAVVFKPYNVLVVRGRGNKNQTLLDWAINTFGKAVRPVHRIDRVTCGAVILAKSLYAQQALSNAFRKRLVNKSYLAVVEGIPSKKKLSIDARLKRIDRPNANHGPMAFSKVSEDGERALTHIKVLESTTEYTLIEAKPVTGRMHQIRVHLAHIGHPIVGDKLYGSKISFFKNAIWLFAASVSFPLPRGGKMQVKAPMPKSLIKWLSDAKFHTKTPN